MVAQIESMAAVGKMPWAGLGVEVSNNMSPEQMLKAAKCDWTVSLRKTAYKNTKGVWVEDPSKLKLVRDSDDFPLTTCGTSWKPVQNTEVADFFKKFVTSGHMTMEHMGSLDHGRYLWALANINQSFTLGKEDAIKNYLLLIQPHVQGRAMVFKFMSIRQWCWNTLGLLLGTGVGRKGVIGNGFRMAHSMKFDDKMRSKAEEALGFAVKQTTELKEAVTLLSKKKVTAQKVEEYFCEVLKFDPKKADKKKDGGIKEPRMLPLLRTALVQSPGAQLGTAQGTMWGAYNAISYVSDHELGRSRDTALRNAWLGHLATVKKQAFELAIAYAK
jgi:phage/plasmid-like protein (TIGR03299 family)